MTTSRQGPAPPRDRYKGPAMLPGASAWPALLAASVPVLAVGVLLLAWPKATLTVVAILIGAALLVTGVMRLYDGFAAKDESGGRRAADLLIGVLAVIAGLYCLRHHALSIAIVAFVVGTFWILFGVADLAVSVTSELPGRGLRAIGGVISLVAGLLVLLWPAVTVILLVRILGIWLIIYAVILAMLALRIRADARHRRHQPPPAGPA
ncbi:MAG TPA: DUF308 domain-containing protein [Streptosporangiaceae bacterium]|jgi:uncharacterized membrane protein HdeD (DUF308 family)